MMAAIFYFLCIFAWLTHVVVCIQEYMWGLLLVGGLIFPVGIIHGVMVWLGAV